MTTIDRRIAAADPLRADLSTVPDEAAQALLQEIKMHHTTTVVPPKPRRRRRLALLALATAGALTVPGAAYAVYQGMHSGVVGTGGEEVAGEEFLYADSPEIVAVVRELTTEFPLPPGDDYDEVLVRYPAKERILVQRTALGQEVAYNAACMWYRHWLSADAPTRATAQQTIDAIPTWPYVNQTGSPLARIAAETRTGKETTLRQFVRANC